MQSFNNNLLINIAAVIWANGGTIPGNIKIGYSTINYYS